MNKILAAAVAATVGFSSAAWADSLTIGVSWSNFQEERWQTDEAAIRAARAIDIPVVGIDFMVPSPYEPEYAFIEANERPGLANHEPQPTAERFVDLLFPATRALPRGWTPGAAGADHRAEGPVVE